MAPFNPPPDASSAPFPPLIANPVAPGDSTNSMEYGLIATKGKSLRLLELSCLDYDNHL
jgi:hypothetical protein